MKKVFFYLLCAASLAGCLEAATTEGETEQTGQIWGYVSDLDYRSEISGAQVELSPANLTCKTDSKGYYGFVNLEPGTYKVTVNADGYVGRYRQITINPGREFVCDFYLRESVNSYAEVSPGEGLDFGRGKDVLAVTLKAHNAALDYHSELEGNPTWVALEKNDGTIPDYEKTSKVEYLKLTVDRNKMKKDEETCYLVVRAGRKDFRVKVTAKRNAVNDYSSATVTSCDRRIDAKIVSCVRSGSSVVFNYTLTNTGLGDVRQFRISTPRSGSPTTVIYDDKGNEYISSYKVAFREYSETNGTYPLNTSFPEGPECKGSITISNVPSDVKSITYLIGVYIYMGPELEGNRISFKNVPVYD